MTDCKWLARSAAVGCVPGEQAWVFLAKFFRFGNFRLTVFSSGSPIDRIEIDNNQIENKIHPLALGRKNYRFAGSNKGAERAAMMYSFFVSWKEHDVNPCDWLRDVLVRIGSPSG